MPEPALVVENYSFWYKLVGGERLLALEDVSLEIAKGDFVLVLGASGAGKSTLALNLVGIYPDYFGGYNEGRVLFNHRTKGLVNRRELTKGERFQTVNMLFQNPEDQIVTLTVLEEVAFALENYLVPRDEIPRRVTRALGLVGLEGFEDRSTLKLSGGEKQRVALAAMLAMEPSVLILDEPTSNLDPVGTEEVLSAVAHVREEIDITLIIVEHEVDEVFHQVDKALLVEGKHVLGPYTPREFMTKHGLEVRDHMGLWIPQATEVGLELQSEGISLSTTPLTGAELLTALGDQRSHVAPRRAGNGRGSERAEEKRAEVERSRREPGDVVIEVRDVGFSYPSKADVLCGIDLDVRRNELLAIVGQNGSGKSTLAAHMNGLLKPASGRVLVMGKPTTSYKFAELAKHVAYIFQMPEKQFIRNSVHDEMAHGLKALKLSEDDIEKRVEAVLQEVRLEDRKEVSPYVLSHGQKRRLSVACMVVTDPEVVVLDEPTFGQDWRQAQKLMEFMRTLADQGAAVVFITHDMRLVAEYADRCAAMSEGRIIFDGAPEVMFADEPVLNKARLKPPPVFGFSQTLIGRPALSSTELIEILRRDDGRPRTLV